MLRVCDPTCRPEHDEHVEECIKGIIRSSGPNKVRMVLEDYDAAPDGAEMYTKFDGEFDNVNAAKIYRARYYHSMYWGGIYDHTGKLLCRLEEYE
jgi:hypothetical protein